MRAKNVHSYSQLSHVCILLSILLINVNFIYILCTLYHVFYYFTSFSIVSLNNCLYEGPTEKKYSAYFNICCI